MPALSLPVWRVIWLLTTTCFILLLTLSPYDFSSQAQTFSWDYRPTDVRDNLLLLAPIGLCLAFGFGPVKWWGWIVYLVCGLGISSGIEYAQLYLPTRTSQYWDVIANTLSLPLGAAIGAGLRAGVQQLPTKLRFVMIAPAMLLPVPYLLSSLAAINNIAIMFSLAFVYTSTLVISFALLVQYHTLAKTSVATVMYFALLLAGWIIQAPEIYFVTLLSAALLIPVLTWLIKRSAVARVLLILVLLISLFNSLYLIIIQFYQVAHSPIVTGATTLAITLMIMAGMYAALGLTQLTGARAQLTVWLYTLTAIAGMMLVVTNYASITLILPALAISLLHVANTSSSKRLQYG
ncbi:VanZ family protein [Salinimonas marina]|uniref:VanZ family protein n=1 Tax=Salinimonas marina TaxID=2785918 RepID=A0A7S9HD30_9ALTE|nr:VanZ family protein [Salinimonas marina]QPG05131.1 VanZ family protein [Salinimonas marina]